MKNDMNDMKHDKGIKARYKNLSKKQKVLLFGVMTILLMGTFVTAYYAFFYTSTTAYLISGGAGDPLVVVTDFSDQDFDVSITDTITQLLSFTNTDGQTNMTLGMEVSYIPIDLDCPNGENDVQFVFENYLGEIENGGTFLLNGGSADFYLVASVDPVYQSRVCDGDYSVTITMSETLQ